MNIANALIIDIETGPFADEVVLRYMKPFEDFTPPAMDPIEPAAPFDEEACKAAFATAKDPEKGPAFIAKKREEHNNKASAAVQAAALKAGAKLEKARLEHEEKRAKYIADFIERATLKPWTSKVEAVGLITETDESLILEGDERDILRQVWRAFEGARRGGRTVAGWNLEAFDLTFLVRRSWACGVTVPSWLYKGRYMAETFVDLMRVFTCNAYGQDAFCKLDTAAQFLLGEGKPIEDGKPDGASFWKFYRAGGEKREQAIRYLRRDLRLTKAVGSRMADCTALPGKVGGDLVDNFSPELELPGMTPRA